MSFSVRDFHKSNSCVHFSLHLFLLASSGRIVSLNGPLLEHTWLQCIGRDRRCGAAKISLSA